MDSISATFFSRRHFLISVSRAIALFNVAEDFEVDKVGYVVFAGETVGLHGFVLEGSGGYESSYADVQNTAFAGHDVDVIAFLVWLGQQIPPRHFVPCRNDKLNEGLCARLDVTLAAFFNVGK